MADKVALITGTKGQDGAYLAELLLKKVTPSTASSADRRPSVPSASITSMSTLMSRTRVSTYTTAT